MALDDQVCIKIELLLSHGAAIEHKHRAVERGHPAETAGIGCGCGRGCVWSLLSSQLLPGSMSLKGGAAGLLLSVTCVLM
jgi:hypothetical protein